MILYFLSLKKYIYYLMFFFISLSIIIGFREIENINFFLSLYKEEASVIKLLINNILVFLPFILPLIFFYSTIFYLLYLKNSNIIKINILSGNSNNVFYFITIFFCIIFIIISTFFVHIYTPKKIKENDEIISKILMDKPYLVFSPLIFNRVSNNYLLYFSEFGKSKKEIKNIIVYKLKKGMIKSITHVKKGSINENGDLFLTNGISVILGEFGETGIPLYLSDKIENSEKKYDEIKRENLKAILPENRGRSDKLTTIELIKATSNSQGKSRFLKNSEFQRRISLNFSFIYFLLISFILYRNHIINDILLIVLASSLISIIFICKEIYLIILYKNLFSNSFAIIWLVDFSIYIISILTILAILKLFKKVI